MKSDILNKLENLLESENILTVQKEFKALTTQFRSLNSNGVFDNDESEDDHEDDDEFEAGSKESVTEVENVEAPEVSDKNQKTESAPKTGISNSQETDNEPDDTAVVSSKTQELKITEKQDKSNVSSYEKREEQAYERNQVAPTVHLDTDNDNGEPGLKNEADSTADITDNKEIDNSSRANGSSAREKEPQGAASTKTTEKIDVALRFNELVEAFKVKTALQREIKKKIDAETVELAKDLLEELGKLVEKEENISKAFNGFNAIQDKWKSLPKVSNDAYRDLNAEYNKHAEKFFYNINIYKELKELDLKHNLDQKLLVLEDQRRLEELNDVRRMEVEVRLNQDRWNEIGPTFKEEWDKIKDEFWNVTRNIYKKIQEFYNQRKEQQLKNYFIKEGLLNKVKLLSTLELKSHGKWQQKTSEIIEIQNEWKMIGFVPKDKTGIWKEFRKVIDSFFANKRAFYKEIRDEQDANKEQKMALLTKAEGLKDSDDWNEASSKLIEIQKAWKQIGPAHQRDENRMWRNFRETCDYFFQRRNDHRSEEASEYKENLVSKTNLLNELEAFERNEDRNANIEILKQIAEKWRAIGHVPFKMKDKVNTHYKRLMDEKYGSLKIDKKEKEKIRFEQKLEDIKDKGENNHLIRKEQDFIRNKISKLKTECFQLENNMGFFANSKGAEKLKQEVEVKVDKVKEEIDVLKERLTMLRNA